MAEVIGADRLTAIREEVIGRVAKRAQNDWISDRVDPPSYSWFDSQIRRDADYWMPEITALLAEVDRLRHDLEAA